MHLRQFDRDISSELCSPYLYYNFLKLKQFFTVSSLIQIIRKLEEQGADLECLQDMQEKDMGALIRYVPGGRINLSATLSPITRTVLKMDLLIAPDFTWKDRFHGPLVLHYAGGF